MTGPRFGMLAALAIAMLAVAPSPAARTKSKGSAMPASKTCKSDALHRSRCMIELILDELESSLGAVSGGGISQIKAVTSTSYAVSLPQEGRVDIVTYEFEVKDASVTLKGKSTATKSY